MSIVAIVGRPNVGKSTLFNRLVGMRKAIVNDTAGTTRDRHYGKTDWNGREFSVIDTGGYALGGEDIFEEEIRKQVVLAVEEADVILFLVEVSTGITDLDMAVADLLRRTSKKVILVVNKVDNNNLVYGSHEFYALGLGDPYCISSISGSGTGDLMDAVVAALPPDTEAEQTDDLPKFAIVGRPNVGKSSLTNALLDRERNIVTPIAGTTRDSILTRYNKFGMDFYLIDTAGLRKKTKVTDDLEFYSVLRSIRSIESSDVCILMIDASAGVEAQDMNIFRLIERNKKGCVIVINKWDLVEKGSNTMKEHPSPHRSVRRRADRLHVGAEQAAYSGRVADGHERLLRAHPPDSDFGAERVSAADYRADASAVDQGQVHPHQVCHSTGFPDSGFRVLRQFAAVYQGGISSLSGEQDPREVGLQGSADSDFLPPEVALAPGLAALPLSCFTSRERRTAESINRKTETQGFRFAIP